MRGAVRRLVKGGQLTFVNGGYVQNDEAGSHFVAMIDQTTLGHRSGSLNLQTRPAGTAMWRRIWLD